MLPASPSVIPSTTIDDCTICLNALAPGTPILTLSCGHIFHLTCLASNVQARNKECPLCRATIDASVVQLLAGPIQPPVQQQQTALFQFVPPAINAGNAAIAPIVIPSVEDLADEVTVRDLSDRFAAARQAAVAASNAGNNLPLITASTTLEYRAQFSHEESNIYGLVTLQAPPPFVLPEGESLLSSHVPIDIVCVVDQSGSMSGEKITLLKQTLVYITQQMSELDRLAIVSFNTVAFDRSHGLKRMNQLNQQILISAINDDIRDGGGTYIGSGLQMGMNLLINRQTKNPLSALLLLTDGQDNQQHDYTQLMQTLPSGVQCHTFGYGPDHTVALLVRLAEEGNGGTFTYVDNEQAVGPAFAMTLGGLFTCVAQQLQVNIEFTGEYKTTHVHSKYKYEPQQLPATKITFKLHDLNANENRNLVFQLHVPKLNDVQNADMASQQPMSLGESSDEIVLFESQIIGNVTVTYLDTNSRRTITTTPVAFQLVRDSHPPADFLQVNHDLDVQRNRVETARALERAMAEGGYGLSLAILKAQVEKIKASVSAQDPFCQQLIKDLEHRYPSERDYRQSRQNEYMSHTTERGTYATPTTLSTEQYMIPSQVAQVQHFWRTQNPGN